jgi:membrane protein
MNARLHTWHRHATDLLRHRIWEPDILAVSRLQRWAFRQLRVTVIFASGLARGRIQLRASAMTFTTLLTLGPILVLALSVFRAFGALEGLRQQVEDFLVGNLAPGSQGQVQEWLRSFFAAADRGAFREVSILVLAGAVVGLLGSLEQAFNDIWGVHRGRSLFQRFSIYTTLVVFGPILIGLSLSATASLETLALQNWLATFPAGFETLLGVVFQLAPVLLTGIAFTLLYTILPNVRVSLRASLPAGLVAGTLWEILKLGYGAYMRTAVHYGTLYGALAAVPFFLIWVYVSWLVVLFGAQLAFAREAAQDFRLEVGAAKAGLEERFRAGLHVALETVRCYRDELDPPELTDLSRRLRLPLRLVRTVAETLVDGGVLHQVASGRREMILVPARNPEKISVYDVYACLTGPSGGAGETGGAAGAETAQGVAGAAGPNTGSPTRGGRAGVPLDARAAHAASTVDALVFNVARDLRQKWDQHSLLEVLASEDRQRRQGVLPFTLLRGRVRARGSLDRP